MVYRYYKHFLSVIIDVLNNSIPIRMIMYNSIGKYVIK